MQHQPLFAISTETYLNAKRIVNVTCALMGYMTDDLNPVTYRTFALGISAALMDYMSENPNTAINGEFIATLCTACFNASIQLGTVNTYTQLATTILDLQDFLNNELN